MIGEREDSLSIKHKMADLLESGDLAGEMDFWFLAKGVAYKKI